MTKRVAHSKSEYKRVKAQGGEIDPPPTGVMADHAALQRLAEQATPGPWRLAGVDKFNSDGECERVIDAPSNSIVATVPTGEFEIEDVLDGTVAQHDAAYIAAVYPQVVLALLADVARLTKEVTRHTLGTDETTLAFHRDMALRFAEDRDAQKHRVRELTADVARLREENETLKAALDALRETSMDLADDKNSACASRDSAIDELQHAEADLAQAEETIARLRGGAPR